MRAGLTMKLKFPVRELLLAGDGVIVLYPDDLLSRKTHPRTYENIQMLDRKGKVLWTVHGMEKLTGFDMENDTFIGLSSDGADIVATSFHGFQYKIDPVNGQAVFHASKA